MPLIDDLCIYANMSHANAYRTLKVGKSMDEPALVSSLLSKELLPSIRQILRQHVVPGAKILTRGIFTHQTPWVKMNGASASSEIADLMLVHKHFHPDGISIGNALLLQAKRKFDPHTGPLDNSGDQIQFDLYRTWMQFNGTRRLINAPNGSAFWDFNLGGFGTGTDGSGFLTVFNEQAFDLHPEFGPPLPKIQWWKSQPVLSPTTMFNGGMYPSDCTWSTGPSPSPLALSTGGVDCPKDFGTTLSNFLHGTTGRLFIPGATDHWSIFVELMLGESAKSSYRYAMKKIGITAGLRGRNLGFVSALAHCYDATWESMHNYDSDLIDTYRFGSELEWLAGRSEGGELPPADGYEFPTHFFGAHVPILLILTTGDDCHPFRE